MPKLKILALIVAISWIVSAAVGVDDDRLPIKFQAKYQLQEGSRTGRVMIVCEIPEGRHIYSLQQTSPPGPTKIQVADSNAFKTTDAFAANHKPTVIEHDPVFETRLEQFDGKVTFSAPIELATGAQLEKQTIELVVNCQVCSDSGCVLVRNKKIEARFGGYFDPNAEKEGNQPPSSKDAGGGKDN